MSLNMMVSSRSCPPSFNPSGFFISSFTSPAGTYCANAARVLRFSRSSISTRKAEMIAQFAVSTPPGITMFTQA